MESVGVGGEGGVGVSSEEGGGSAAVEKLMKTIAVQREREREKGRERECVFGVYIQ